MAVALSNDTLAAKKKRQALEANKPQAYSSAYQGQMDKTMDQILNREKFSYDLDGDAMYQQYKDRYTQQGKMAMMDTMGQAAGLTGGYGSSYAQQVGQQAYQGYLQALNDKIPELYQLALSKYQAEGQELQDRLSLLGAMDDRDYGRHRDAMSDWRTELDRVDNEYYQGLSYDQNNYWNEQEMANSNYWKQKSYDQQAAQDAKEQELAVAQMMADAGDYSRLAKYYGLSEAEVMQLHLAAAAGDGGDGTASGTTGGMTYDEYVAKKNQAISHGETLSSDRADAFIQRFSGYLDMGYSDDEVKGMLEDALENTSDTFGLTYEDIWIINDHFGLGLEKRARK